MSEQAHMVKQVIHFSDGSEKVINYRGKYVDGVLVLDEVESAVAEESAPAPVAEAVEAPVEVAPVSEEVVAEAPAEAPVAEEASINS